ncbi:uncharacterized protein LOC127006830 [Eriocheir sinensis]|uniref:uncharacterized protein LOC127006830 n=1 Tax=Eriocheir sinensis TaxID=95602 RepID=UPI0021CA7821|nr:uncharacterized protein LOC127006830 [Eriocheir sinensis]
MRAATPSASLLVVPLLLSCCLTLALLPLTVAAPHHHDPRGPYSFRRLLPARPPYPQQGFFYPSEVQPDHSAEVKGERRAEEGYLESKILELFQRYLHLSHRPSTFPSTHYDDDQPLLQALPPSHSHAASTAYIKRSGPEGKYEAPVMSGEARASP